MSPAMRVALSSGAGALGGALVGGLLGFTGAALAGARQHTKGRELSILIGVAVGAAAGSAGLGAYTEHKELQAANAPAGG